MKKVIAVVLWLTVALLGTWAYLTLALQRGEVVNSFYLLLAALCSYTLGYRFYSKWIAARVLALNDRRATPCEVHDDGKDFVKTNKWIVFGHHFAAIAGPGPLVGPVLAAQFGYLPGTLWILIGVVLGGAVQDFVILFASLRRDGKSLGQMVKEELNTPAGTVALTAILAIMTILLAVLALVVVKALAESPWGVFTVGATIPIAMFMGGYLRFVRVGKVMEASAIGVIGLLAAVWAGKLIYQSPEWSRLFGLSAITLAWVVILYGLAASILPVWLLLAPRDYLSTFMKLGTIFALAVGIFLVLPDLKMPALSRFTDGTGLVVAGKVFPFCFITIACGAISGFHTLIASGTTPKLITRESYARPIGYGAMCLESLVAIMAMIAACTLEPGVYLAMNTSVTGPDPAAVESTIRSKVDAAQFTYPVRGQGVTIWQTARVSALEMKQQADRMGEKTLYGRTGGAATLAVGMANIFSGLTRGRWLDVWYHFAIMFEALFILTTLDAGTRVGRYILQDSLGNLWKPLGDTRNIGANFVASGLMVCGWGYFLVQGVRDPLGGINSLWPLFGIANQMLATLALCLATTLILKMQLPPEAKSTVQSPMFKVGRPWLALVSFVPLVWLVAVTFTAGVQKIFHSNVRIGFWAAATDYGFQWKNYELKHGDAIAEWLQAPKQHPEHLKKVEDWRRLKTLQANNILDAFVAGGFLALVSCVVLLSVREWILLLARRKSAELRETEPVWLAEYAVKEGGPSLGTAAGTVAIVLGLAKELSGEAATERALKQDAIGVCDAAHSQASCQAAYLRATEDRFTGVRRCC